MAFGPLLRRLRIDAELSQEALAERAGKMSADAVSALERGRHRAPPRETVELLAKALGVSEHVRKQLEAVAASQRIRRRDGDEAFVLQPADAPPSNVPVALTDIIGRVAPSPQT